MNGQYVVIANNIIVPNVTSIDIKKNVINMNPRAIIDTGLSGDYMPANVVITTATNIEDFFRINTPLIVVKKANTTAEIIAAQQTLSYMFNMTYNDTSAAANMSAILALGFLPVFFGRWLGYHTASAVSTESALYEHILVGLDNGSFLEYPYKPIMKNLLPDFIGEPASISNNKTNTGIISSPDGRLFGIPEDYRGKLKPAIGGEINVFGRAPYVCTAVANFLEKLPVYQAYLRQILLSSKSLDAVAINPAITLLTGSGILDAATSIAIKRASTLKVPVLKFEDTTEAIRETAIENILARSGGENVSFANILRFFCPNYFYETFSREDTGEFVFRRANWIGLPKSSGSLALASRQTYQNTLPWVAIPTNAITSYQKVWGARLGEFADTNVFSQTHLQLRNMKTYVELGELNKEKFGSSQSNEDIFGILHTLDDMPLEGGSSIKKSDEFFLDSYYDLRRDDILDKTKSFSVLRGGEDGPLSNSMHKMLNWISKYHHSYGYTTWIGFSTYFVAPIGAAIRPIVTAHLPSDFSVTGGRLTLNPTDSFASIEALNLQRIIGKGLKVEFQADGEYKEEYYLMLGNAGAGFSQRA